MTQYDMLASLDEKIRLLARDIYDTAVIENALKLEHFVPSKQIQNLLDEEEVARLITFLKRRGILTYAFREASSSPILGNASKESYPSFTIIISQPRIRRLLNLEENVSKQVDGGVRLHPEFSSLIINGKEIPLSKGKLHKSLQYWICRLCLKKPNIPVQETNIMAKYATDYDITARSRAIRDAVYKLNPKIKNATGIDELFTYSNGYVVFNADKLK